VVCIGVCLCSVYVWCAYVVCVCGVCLWGALQSSPGLGGRGGVEMRQDWTAVGKPWAVGRRGWAEHFLPFSVLDDFYGENISFKIKITLSS